MDMIMAFLDRLGLVILLHLHRTLSAWFETVGTFGLHEVCRKRTAIYTLSDTKAIFTIAEAKCGTLAVMGLCEKCSVMPVEMSNILFDIWLSCMHSLMFVIGANTLCVNVSIDSFASSVLARTVNP
jgi:hypothetical protein